MTDVGENILTGLREAVAIAKGDLKPARIHVPKKVDVKAIREGLGLSQVEFAARFGFSVSSVRNWEQNRRTPDGPARAYLQVIQHDAETVQKALSA